MSKEKNRLFLAVFLLALAIVLLLVSTSMYFQKPISSEEFNVTFQVWQTGIGFDVDNSSLKFGALNPRGTSTRKVRITNDRYFDIVVKPFLSENLEGLIDIEPVYKIGAGEEKMIPVSLVLPDEFLLGNYTGKIKFNIYRDR